MPQPRPTRPKSNFFGTWHRLFRTPLQGQVTIQFHNLIPGTQFVSADGPRALEPFVLTPDGPNPRWVFRNTKFRLNYNQRLDRMFLNASYRPDNSQIFFLQLALATFVPGYSQIIAPAGNFTFGGTVTMQWAGLP